MNILLYVNMCPAAQASRQAERVSEMELAVYSLQEKLTEKHRREEVIVSFIENNLPENDVEEFRRFLFDMDTGADRATARPTAQYPIGSRLGSMNTENRGDEDNSFSDTRTKGLTFGRSKSDSNNGYSRDTAIDDIYSDHEPANQRIKQKYGGSPSAKVKKARDGLV